MGDVEYRPVGLALAPNGTLLIADLIKGRIWYIHYRGADPQK